MGGVGGVAGTIKPLSLPLSEGVGGRHRSPDAGAAGRLPPAGSPNLVKIQKAAQDFEAMAIGQLLAPMFDTVDTAHGLFGGGAGEETWKPMLIAEFGKHIAAHGGFGLAAPIVAAMIRMQEARPVGSQAAQPQPADQRSAPP